MNWNEHLGRHVMLLDLADPGGWTKPIKVLPGATGWYPQVLGTRKGDTDKVPREMARLFVGGRSDWQFDFSRLGLSLGSVGGGPRSSLAGGSSLVVFKGARHPDQAWQLIEFPSRPAVQAEIHGAMMDLPAMRSAWRSARLAGDPAVGAFYQQL